MINTVIQGDCLECGEVLPRKRKPCEIKKGDCKFCSKKCYFSFQKGKKKIIKNPVNRKGKNNPNWKGGLASEHTLIRRSQSYKFWRESVFQRDNWTCKHCGVRSKKGCAIVIEAHHIKPFALFPELRLEITNGLTLCRSCHHKEPKGREILCIK